MKKIMTRAHQIAKILEGNYTARLALALKLAWREAKSTKKAVIIKETLKAKMLVLYFQDILGEEREIKTWFPNGWLQDNNIPKMWALKKKVAEIRNLYSQWDLIIKKVLVA